CTPYCSPIAKRMVLCLLLGHFVINLGKLNPTNPSWRICLVQHVFPEFSSPAGHLRAKLQHPFQKKLA
ncbi:unnamed protein product, partial [Brassica oleracea var. botrytis]